jgi:site-specific DNA-methyltransferase (adenine-specific)
MLELDKIHCGDNCDLLGQLPRECIDLVVTSPPYDDLRTYGGHSWDFFGVAWQLKRVLKPGGVIVWVVADATKDGSETGSSMEQALHFKRLGLNLHDTMIWQKPNFAAVGALQTRYAPVFEYMFVLSDGKPKTFNPIKDRAAISAGKAKSGTIRNADGSMKRKSSEGWVQPEFGQRFNVWEMPTESQGQDHPAPFPLALARDHIATWSNPGDLVLDPFSGSGTTAKAAKELGRRFLGLEINPEYCAIAERRIAQQVLELDAV